MQAIFYAPTGTGGLVETFGGQRRAEHVVGGPCADLDGCFAYADDLADRRGSWLGVLLLQPHDTG